MSTRRNFLRLSALTALTSTIVPSIVQNANKHLATNPLSNIAKGSAILFQGDSITDASRNRGDYYANAGSGMGGGYVHHTVTHLLGK